MHSSIFKVTPISLCVLAILLVLMPEYCANAMPANAIAEESAASADNLTDQDLASLITTLESEDKRRNFIANLKTLQTAKEEVSEGQQTQIPLLKNIDFEHYSNSLLNQISESIGMQGISDSGMINLLKLVLLVFALVMLMLANGWVSRKINRSLNSVRRRLQLSNSRFSIYFLLQRWFGYLIAVVVLIFSLGQVLDLSSIPLVSGINAQNVFVELINIMLVAVIFISLWEIILTFMEILSNRSQIAANPRMLTLIPFLRNIFLSIVMILAILVVLSELGINIMPLLAGAGVLGIAIGFGAQALFKDFITGIAIIFEDLLQIGDVVTVSGRTGLVERITIRKVQLRALNGTVHTVPFGEITIVDNLTKEYSYYLMDIGVAYRENTDEVISCLKTIDEQLRDDDEFKNLILEPIEIFGLDKFSDSAIMIKARIKTLPREQWTVGREFNRRMKIAFDEHGIEIPFPHRTLYFGEDKEGRSPSAKMQVIASRSQCDACE